MNGTKHHIGDDELLMIIMDAPSHWMVRNGIESSSTSTLRQALRKAREYSYQGNFSGRIVKQPNDEMVVEAHQINRLWEHLDHAS